MPAGLKKRIELILRSSFFSAEDDVVLVRDSSESGNLHVLIISSAFDDPERQVDHDAVWSTLVEKLTPDEWGRITLLLCRTPEEVMTI